MEQTSVTLLERLRDGSDELAWGDFLRRYWRPLFVFARRQGLSEQSAEEVVQEVVVAIFQNRTIFCYDAQKGRFSNYLFKIVVQRIALHHRVVSRRREVANHESANGEIELGGDTAPAVEGQFERLFEESLLGVMLDVVRREVEPATFQAFELVTLHGVTPADAARMTGLSRNAVYLAKKRVVGRLQELGAPYTQDGELHELLKEVVGKELPTGATQSMTASISQRLSICMPNGNGG